MAERIIVLSPLHNGGASTVATLIAHNAACKGRSSVLCYTAANSPIPDYLGIEDTTDPTRAITQVTRLIDVGGITDAEILQYTFPYDKRHPAYMLNTGDPTLDEISRKQVIKFIFSHITTDVVICDVSEDIQDTVAQELVEEADGVIIVIQPSEKYYARTRAWLQMDCLTNHKNVFILVNTYHEVIGSVRELANAIGIKAVSLLKMHYNPWIAYCSQHGELANIVRTSIMSDPRTVNLTNDFVELDQAIRAIILQAPNRDAGTIEKIKKLMHID